MVRFTARDARSRSPVTTAGLTASAGRSANDARVTGGHDVGDARPRCGCNGRVALGRAVCFSRPPAPDASDLTTQTGAGWPPSRSEGSSPGHYHVLVEAQAS